MARKVITETGRRLARRNTLLGVGIGLLAIVIGVAIFALISYGRLTAVPPPPPEADLSASAPDTGYPTVMPLEAQLEELERAARSGRHEPFALNLRPVDLQATLAARLEGQGIENLRVYLGEGTMVFQGEANIEDRRLYATVRARPRIEDGQLRLDVEDAKIGTLTMPARLREELQRELDKSLIGKPPRQTGVWLEGITVSPYGMSITGRTGQVGGGY